MGQVRTGGAGRLRRGGPAAVAAVLMTMAALAGGAGPAAAAPGVRLATAGDISTVAGGVGGPAKATTVALFDPCGVTFGAGQVYAADFSVVRAVDPGTDRLTTPAGIGINGPLGDGSRATKASLVQACDTAVDHSGNLVIADAIHNRIRIVAARTGTFYGRAMTAGDIYTVAGAGSRGGFSGDGGPATQAKLRNPASVAVDAAGNLVIGDASNFRIRVVAASTGTFYGQAMTAGDIYTIAGTGTLGFSGNGGPAASAELGNPSGVAVDAAGNVLIADSLNHRVRVVAAGTGTFYGRAMTAGDIYTVAGNGGYDFCGEGTGMFSGDGGPATRAELNTPEGLRGDAAGNRLIADSCNRRVRVVAAGTGTFYGRAMTAGDIYTAAGNGTSGFSGDGGPATRAKLSNPVSVATGAAGNLVIADAGNFRVRVVAAGTGTFYGRAMTAGDIYTIAGDGTSGFSGDGGPATSAELDRPAGLEIGRAHV